MALAGVQYCGCRDYHWGRPLDMQYPCGTGDRLIMTSSKLQRGNIVNPGSGRRRFAASVVMLSVVSMIAAGCSDFRRAIGESKSAPDEFEVVVRPPLSLPPSFAASASDLTENSNSTAGAAPAGDGEGSARSRAAAVFGSSKTAVGEGYGELFRFELVPASIREKIDEETYGIRFERRLPLQALFGGLPDIGPILDKVAEDNRLRQNLRSGLMPADGATPGIDAQTNEPVSVGD
jgi:hypothetical protein